MSAIDPERDIHGWLAHHEQKELLRFVTVGSVDDGKSTLIGRLLHDTAAVFDDQLAAVRKATARRGGVDDEEIDFSLFTDGLAAEREQGITIDVAYRYFATERRKYILADTPGHVQYTRNMATGASTSDVAIILLDARLGVLPQSRRHAHIAALLGIPDLLVAVNKMDLAGYEQRVFERLRDEFSEFASGQPFKWVTFVPISARKGDNVVHRSQRTPWYEGETVLEHLERAPVSRGGAEAPLRFPVQYVLRPHLDYRAFAGSVASGAVRPGDLVEVLPSGRQTRVKAVDLAGVEVAEALAPQSVALRLVDEIDVARGDMIVHLGRGPRSSERLVADLVWMTERPSDGARSYLVKHTTRVSPARVERVLSRVDMESLESVPASALGLNDIGRAVIRSARPLFADPYRQNRSTGAFILIDALTNETVAAGMVRDESPPAEGGPSASFISPVGADERASRVGHPSALVWINLPAPQESTSIGATLASALERALFDDGVLAATAHGDESRVVGASLGVLSLGGVAIVLASGLRPEVRALLRDLVGARFVGVGAVSGEGDDALPLPSSEDQVAVCSQSVRAALAVLGVRGAHRS